MPIIDNPRMGQELKNLVRSTFPEFFQVNGTSSGKIPDSSSGSKVDSESGVSSNLEGHSDSDA
jgi:hypothetical protein